MARVKNPLNSAEASGLVGGLEYRTTRNGAVVGRRSIATPVLNARTSAIHYRLARAHQLWTALSDKNKASWQRIVTDPRDARSYYIGAYCRLIRANLTPMSPCPARPAAPVSQLPVFSAWSVGLIRCTVTITCTANSRYGWHISRLCSFRRLTNPDLGKFVYVTNRSLGDGPTSVYLPHLSPYVLFLCQLLDRQTGEIYQQHIIDGAPTWDAGPGDLLGMAPDLPDDISGPPPEDEPA